LDARLTKINHWLTHDLQLVINNIHVASADASFRRYFRITLDTQAPQPKLFKQSESVNSVV